MDLESNPQPLKPPLTDQNVQDAQDLAALGHSQALTRKFDMWSMLALAFCVLGMFALFATPMGSERVLTCPRNLLDLRPGSQQWSNERWCYHYPLGSGAGHSMQPLCCALPGRVD